MINEMMSMGKNCYGFNDSFVSLVEKPKIHVASEQGTAPSTIDREFGPTFVRDVFTNMFELNDACIITYVFNDEAMEHYDTLLEEHATDFSSQYLSDTGK